MKDLDFEAIFERYHQALYRYCLSIVRNPEDAREALQSTMVKALRALPAEEREIKLKPWLYRVAHNESIEVLRKRQDHAELDVELAGSTGWLAEDAEARERLRVLIADLGELPERQRAALVMRELGGLEFDEIGTALDTSTPAARQTVYEARLSLQQLQAGREMDCGKVRWELSAEDRRVLRRRDVQAHLRECADCRAFRDAIDSRKRDLAALAPLPAAMSAGILQAVLGGKAAGGGAIAASGALGKVAATSPAMKAVATMAVVAAVAVPAAERSGLLHAGPFERGSTGAAETSSEATTKGGSPGSPADQAAARGQAATAIGAQAGATRGGRTSGGAVSGSGETAGANPTEPQPGDGEPGSPGRSEAAGASEGDLPSASAHGQETAAAHGGGRESARSKGGQHAHEPAAPTGHDHAKPTPGSGAPSPGGGHEGRPPAQPPVQVPAVPPDKADEPSLQPPNGNPAPAEEAGAEEAKEAR